MTFRGLRDAVLGSNRDVADHQQVLGRVTVGVLAAWIAMGGDLLGSCVYGPDVLARSSSGHRAVFLIASIGTLVTLAVLAYAYIRMIAQFPDGGGGYTAAKHVVSQRTSLVSGVALVVDAAFNVAVSVATCVHAAGDAIPGGLGRAKLPVAIGLVVLLTVLNLRGVKESVVVLVPIVLAFVTSHIVVLGLAIVERATALPGIVASAPAELQQLAAEKGSLGMAGALVAAYALGGAIYTGLESVSNGVPVLREPKVRSARRTMLLVAGIPGMLIAVILASYLLYDVAPESERTMNALLFERVAGRGVGSSAWYPVLVTVPLAAEALLLVMAAQTGFVDGPRIIGALATDRFLPRRLTRLNGRLAPAPGILVVAVIALGATVLTGANLQRLISVFVLSVFVTFTISQWAMLRHAFRRRAERGWRADALVHAVALFMCLVIFAGSVWAWRVGALVTLGLIGGGVALALAVRSRYDAMAHAVRRAAEDASLPVVPRHERPPDVSTGDLIARDAPIALLVLGERPDFARVALEWLSRMSNGIGGVVLGHVSLIDAEAVQGEERLRELERERRAKLERVAQDVRRAGLPVSVEMRRGADVVEASAELVTDVFRGRPRGSVVVGFRSNVDSRAVDALLRDDVALRLQDRLARENIPMIVASVPLDA
jgi:amino acid transporter